MRFYQKIDRKLFSFFPMHNIYTSSGSKIQRKKFKDQTGKTKYGAGRRGQRRQLPFKLFENIKKKKEK